MILLDAADVGIWSEVLDAETCVVEPIRTVVDTLLSTDISLEITTALMVVSEVNFGVVVVVVEWTIDVDVVEVDCSEDIIEESTKEAEGDDVKKIVDVLELEMIEMVADVNGVDETVACSNNDNPEKEIVVVVVYVANGSNETIFPDDKVDEDDCNMDKSGEYVV